MESGGLQCNETLAMRHFESSASRILLNRIASQGAGVQFVTIGDDLPRGIECLELFVNAIASSSRFRLFAHGGIATKVGGSWMGCNPESTC